MIIRYLFEYYYASNLCSICAFKTTEMESGLRHESNNDKTQPPDIQFVSWQIHFTLRILHISLTQAFENTKHVEELLQNGCTHR